MGKLLYVDIGTYWRYIDVIMGLIVIIAYVVISLMDNLDGIKGFLYCGVV
jgi:hypothetical protein